MLTFVNALTPEEPEFPGAARSRFEQVGMGFPKPARKLTPGQRNAIGIGTKDAAVFAFLANNYLIQLALRSGRLQ